LIQGFFLEEALGERIGLTDEEWALIGPLLPPERGRGCRPAQDNRLYFEGMMWMARTGAQWRHLPDEYGKWNSVFRRYLRISGDREHGFHRIVSTDFTGS
jgi:transposase